MWRLALAIAFFLLSPVGIVVGLVTNSLIPIYLSILFAIGCVVMFVLHVIHAARAS